MNNDLISREALKKEIEELVAGGEERLIEYYKHGSKKEENEWIGGIYDAWELIDNAPTVEIYTKYDMTREYLRGYNACNDMNAKPQGEWNTHQVACILAELFGDTCACNYCGIDEWLPKACDFANKECPDVVGVACWEQFLKHRAKMKGGAE